LDPRKQQPDAGEVQGLAECHPQGVHGGGEGVDVGEARDISGAVRGGMGRGIVGPKTGSRSREW